MERERIYGNFKKTCLHKDGVTQMYGLQSLSLITRAGYLLTIAAFSNICTVYVSLIIVNESMNNWNRSSNSDILTVYVSLTMITEELQWKLKFLYFKWSIQEVQY